MGERWRFFWNRDCLRRCLEVGRGRGRLLAGGRETRLCHLGGDRVRIVRALVGDLCENKRQEKCA